MNDCKLRKAGKTALMALGIVMVGGLLMHALTNAGHEQDRADLLKLKASYEKALNSGDFTDLKTGLDKDFTYTTILGNEIKSAAEFENAYKAIQTVIGANKGGSYKITVTPALGKSNFWSKNGEEFAFTRGTTEETVVTAEDQAGKIVKKSNAFGSLWFATAHKDAGTWKLVHAYAMFSKNPFTQAQIDGFTAALQKAAVH